MQVGTQKLHHPFFSSELSYPEYISSCISFKSQYVVEGAPIEGSFHLSVKSGVLNYFYDVLIQVQAYAEHLFSNLTHFKYCLYELEQRGAVPFTEGLPPGEYSFPFIFHLPPDLPPSVGLLKSSTSLFSDAGHTFQGNIFYRIVATILHKTGSSRSNIRLSAPFFRQQQQHPSTVITQPTSLWKWFSAGRNPRFIVKAQLSKDVYLVDEPIELSVFTKSYSDFFFRSVTAKIVQMVQVSMKDGFETLTTSKETIVATLKASQLCSIPADSCWETKICLFPKFSNGCAVQSFDFSLAPTFSVYLDGGFISVSYKVVLKFKRFFHKCRTICLPLTLVDSFSSTFDLDYSNAIVPFKNSCGSSLSKPISQNFPVETVQNTSSHLPDYFTVLNHSPLSFPPSYSL